MKLALRDRYRRRPVGGGLFDVETLVEVEPRSQSILVDIEVPTQPIDEQTKEEWIRIRHGDSTRRLGTLSCIEAEGERIELIDAQVAVLGFGLDSALFDLGELADVERMRPVGNVTAVAWFRDELDIAYPDRDRTLRHAEFIGDLLKGPRLGTQLAGSVPFHVLAAVSHPLIMTNGCGRDVQVTSLDFEELP